MKKTIKDTNWFRLISRIESMTGMKVTHDSKFDDYREYIELEDVDGSIYDISVEPIVTYVVNVDELPN